MTARGQNGAIVFESLLRNPERHPKSYVGYNNNSEGRNMEAIVPALAALRNEYWRPETLVPEIDDFRPVYQQALRRPNDPVDNQRTL